MQYQRYFLYTKSLQSVYVHTLWTFGNCLYRLDIQSYWGNKYNFEILINLQNCSSERFKQLITPFAVSSEQFQYFGT